MKPAYLACYRWTLYSATMSIIKIRWVLSLIFAVFFAALLPASGDATEKRIALIIGVAEYSNILKLKNTVNDTRLIARKLQNLKFDVTLVENPNLAELKEKIANFTFKAEIADVALVYYAGHGIEFAGVNYLIPTDIEANDRNEIVANSVSLDDILLSVDRARQLRIVILDSCRNDPFVDEGSGQSSIFVQNAAVRRAGLAPASPERGTLVAFAAEAGQVASDGEGSNSPFALAISQHLETPDLEIGLMFRRIRDSVLEATGNTQEPHTYGSLPGKPYFFAGESQSSNTLTSSEQRKAWGSLAPDQEAQMIALADEGDTRALIGLAYMRLNPEETNYDPKRAIALLERAAKTGDAEAQYELARLYEKGIGVAQNVKKAIELYHQAADTNYADAINDLGFLHYQGGLGIIRDKKRALEYFGRAADLRHPEAMFNYAALIDDGLVPGKGPKDAAKYLYNALRTGAEEVLNQLLENPKMFKKPTRLELQKQLSKVTLYTGALDGQIGPGTKRGLKKAYGLQE
ncbi:MAG: caspase family protein [Rhizobiaceae bacterium]